MQVISSPDTGKKIKLLVQYIFGSFLKELVTHYPGLTVVVYPVLYDTTFPDFPPYSIVCLFFDSIMYILYLLFGLFVVLTTITAISDGWNSIVRDMRQEKMEKKIEYLKEKND